MRSSDVGRAQALGAQGVTSTAAAAARSIGTAALISGVNTGVNSGVSSGVAAPEDVGQRKNLQHATEQQQQPGAVGRVPAVSLPSSKRSGGEKGDKRGAGDSAAGGSARRGKVTDPFRNGNLVRMILKLMPPPAQVRQTPRELVEIFTFSGDRTGRFLGVFGSCSEARSCCPLHPGFVYFPGSGTCCLCTFACLALAWLAF